MAATNRAMEVGAAKAALVKEIKELQPKVIAATNSIPRTVIDGSHQVAVLWKEAATDALSDRTCFDTPGRTATAAALAKRRDRLMLRLRLLGGGTLQKMEECWNAITATKARR